MADLQRYLGDRSLSVLNIPQKGCSLFTARDFRPGEVVLSQKPYISVPNNTSSESRCDGCFKTGNLKKCSGCLVVWYCESYFQKSEWKLHRHECKALSMLEKEKRLFVTPTIRLMLKFYIKRNLQDEKVLPTNATDSYSLVEALVSHISEIDEKQLLLYAQMSNLVKLILQFPSLDLREITENFSKVINGYMTLHLNTHENIIINQKRLVILDIGLVLFEEYQFSCNAHSICDSE